MSASYVISKTKYCKAVQCPKILWLDKNDPTAASEQLTDAVIECGIDVGELAREYYGEYEIVEYSKKLEDMCRTTKKLLDNGVENIAEASFAFGDCFCSIDLLRNKDGKLQIVEVKSGTEVEDIHYDEMSFQYYVVTNAGYEVSAVYNMHINNEYVRRGKLDLNGLFILEDCTERVVKGQETVSDVLDGIRDEVVSEKEPVRDIDIYCDKPYECVYKKYCHRNIPEPSVFSIHGLKSTNKYALYHDGIVSFQDIIEKKPKLSEKQYVQVKAEIEDEEPKVDKDAIREFLETLSYPLYHLDFETFQQAIPQFDGIRPYMQIPFQYSLHLQRSKESDAEHYEFLAKEGTDPRRKLAESLCHDIPKGVCSLAYNMTFEKTVIKNLAEEYSDLSEHLMDIHENIHDLMIPFQKLYYYCKEMKGSYSIKYVLPALCPDDPELDYHALDGVHNGSEAMSTYAMLAKHTPEEIEIIRKQLLAYCRLDTLAMVKLLEKLYQIVEDV